MSSLENKVEVANGHHEVMKIIILCWNFRRKRCTRLSLDSLFNFLFKIVSNRSCYLKVISTRLNILKSEFMISSLLIGKTSVHLKHSALLRCRIWEMNRKWIQSQIFSSYRNTALRNPTQSSPGMVEHCQRNLSRGRNNVT